MELDGDNLIVIMDVLLSSMPLGYINHYHLKLPSLCYGEYSREFAPPSNKKVSFSWMMIVPLGRSIAAAADLIGTAFFEMSPSNLT